ncbi:hypothetical protein F4055_00590 [Candidatus Poribacteria bacterium]|nr:hypothetical protein [Candidatus Poribacteria bacterium]
MKISRVFDVLVFFMAVLTFSMPFVTFAQQNSIVVEAMGDAETDANKDVNKPLWFGTGCLISGLVFLPLPGWYSCLLPPAGLAGTYFYQPNPPAGRFIGKSAEYVDAYISTYKSKRGSVQAQWASAGCLSTGVITGVAIFAVGVGIGIGAVAALEE